MRRLLPIQKLIKKAIWLKLYEDKAEVYNSQSDELLTMATLRTHEVDFKQSANTNMNLDVAGLLSNVDAYENWGKSVSTTDAYCNILVKEWHDLLGVDSNGKPEFNRSEYQNASWWGKSL